MPARPVFVIGPDEKAELTITHPASTGRDFDETLRVIDSLQLTATYEVATPANWNGSNDGNIGAAVSDEEMRQWTDETERARGKGLIDVRRN